LERFLQQQDGKTEKYMQLLETYLDDPRRDEIIAREMGWTQLLDEKDWSAEVDALLDETTTEEEGSDVENELPPVKLSRSTIFIALPSISRSGSINCSIKTLRCKTSPRRSSWLPTPLWPARS
jgi:hypothetical protein